MTVLNCDGAGDKPGNYPTDLPFFPGREVSITYSLADGRRNIHWMVRPNNEALSNMQKRTERLLDANPNFVEQVEEMRSAPKAEWHDAFTRWLSDNPTFAAGLETFFGSPKGDAKTPGLIEELEDHHREEGWAIIDTGSSTFHRISFEKEGRSRFLFGMTTPFMECVSLSDTL